MMPEAMPGGDDVPYGIRVRVTQIARDFPAVQYDASDPNAAAIDAYCLILGLEPQPSDAVPPRTIRGAQAAGAAPRDVAAVAATLHALVCRVLPGQPLRACEQDLGLATDLLAALNARGWRLASDPRAAWRAG